jgi:hypothetical protein
LPDVDALSIVFSVLALIGSAVSLTWQFLTWRWSGARLEVVARRAFVPIEGAPDLVSVEVTNSGRQETVVQTIGFLTEQKNQVVQIRCALDQTKLPCTIPPGGSTSFYFELPILKGIVAQNKIRGKLQPFARSGHGEATGKPLDSAAMLTW